MKLKKTNASKLNHSQMILSNKITLSRFCVICFTFIVLSSCNDDFLDVEPQTAITEENAFGTENKILAQVNNLYGQLQSATFYGGRFIVFNEQRADEFGQNDGNAATGSAIWNQNFASTSEYINNVWSAGYTAINASNILIDRLKDSQVVSDSLKNLYTSEAKFVRALSYLCLVQTYATPYFLDKDAPGIPLRLEAITTAGSNDLARSSVSEIYDQILRDLNEAEDGLPTSYPTAILNASRAKKSTAIALKTRVYLHQSDYANVELEAAKIVSDAAPFQYSSNSLTLALEEKVNALYTGSYVGTEAIFSIIFANSTTETPAPQSSLAYNYLTQPIIFLAAQGIAENPALNNPSDDRSSLISQNTANQKLLRKFTTTTAPFRDYVPVIRYVEVLLNYAEAAANNGDLVKALSLLEAVRKRADANFVFPAEEIDSKDALINTILTERRIELVGEGFRLGDLQRRGQTLPSKVGAIGTAPLVLPNAENYIWPIPSGEISTNHLID